MKAAIAPILMHFCVVTYMTSDQRHAVVKLKNIYEKMKRLEKVFDLAF